MNRKRKQEVIEHVIESLKITYSYSNSGVIDVRVADCIGLLSKYYEEEFATEIATEIADETKSEGFVKG